MPRKAKPKTQEATSTADELLVGTVGEELVVTADFSDVLDDEPSNLRAELVSGLAQIGDVEFSDGLVRVGVTPTEPGTISVRLIAGYPGEQPYSKKVYFPANAKAKKAKVVEEVESQ